MKDEEYLKDLVEDFNDKIVENKLPPLHAKLYSQYTRMRMEQPGLKEWRSEESRQRLDEAMQLIDVGLIKRDIKQELWEVPIKRAGELLEWLSHPQLNVDNLPLRSLAAASYQLAGYPALSLGLLNESEGEARDSKLLQSLLQAKFPYLIDYVAEYWSEVLFVNGNETSAGDESYTEQFQQWLVNEITRCFGILCASMRWGTEHRIDDALKKLFALSNLFLHSTDPYSWLLARLCAEIFSTYLNNSMRNHTAGLQENMSGQGKVAIEHYLRSNYNNYRSLAWPSQAEGIRKLLNHSSFAVCTPTGSGKTTIAELAIIQSLFPTTDGYVLDAFGLFEMAPIAMYLVPSRSLAAEVESKLSRVLRDIGNNSVKVTGLYGGIDWGPTDAWLTSNERIVLICTYEKAEALIRFLGPLFLKRVSLVAIDEAHSIQFDGNYQTLSSADNRSLRLEYLANRLLLYLRPECKIIALSAATAGGANLLSNWVSNNTETEPVETPYRSTRQLIGRLEWYKGGRFEIYYDLLNGSDLRFNQAGDQESVPYIYDPVPLYPRRFWDAGPINRIKPYLFWAAMHFAKPDEKGKRHAVLISVTQGIEGYAEYFLNLLESILSSEEIPQFFVEPMGEKETKIWKKCLDSCEDYFGVHSLEYRLLKRGIVVHHGNMPGLTARLFVEVVNARIINLVLATSTLSDGVNMPFETILIPTLHRGQGTVSVREFTNLVGRAGRPGSGTEGRTLVLLEANPGDWSGDNAIRIYNSMIARLKEKNDFIEDNIKSPLAELLNHIHAKWYEITHSNSEDEFIDWLEKTVPLTSGNISDPKRNAEEALDSLDGLLISTIVEMENYNQSDLSLLELEGYLKKIWQRSYAYYVSMQQTKLEKIFIKRGMTVKDNIYSDPSKRRKLYRSGLSPRFGKELIDNYSKILEHLKSGDLYAKWDSEARFEYVRKTIELIGAISKFDAIVKGVGRGKSPVSWESVLQWWLNPSRAKKKPNPKQISKWIKYVNQNFIYRFNWGLGSIIALAIDEAFEGELHAITLDDWTLIGLPWAVFWLKELIVWGTLDPVSAYLLSRGVEGTRFSAELVGKDYLNEKIISGDYDEIMSAFAIGQWVEDHYTSVKGKSKNALPLNIKVKLLRDFSKATQNEWRVLPIVREKEIVWIDPAGYPLASCQKIKAWKKEFIGTYDFILKSSEQIVVSQLYL